MFPRCWSLFPFFFVAFRWLFVRGLNQGLFVYCYCWFVCFVLFFWDVVLRLNDQHPQKHCSVEPIEDKSKIDRLFAEFVIEFFKEVYPKTFEATTPSNQHGSPFKSSLFCNFSYCFQGGKKFVAKTEKLATNHFRDVPTMNHPISLLRLKTGSS